MAHIYIALVDTPGFFAALIRRFLKQRYIHVVLGFDAIFAGFEREDKDKILHTFPTAYYRIYELDCTDAQKRALQQRMQEDYKKRFHIHYAVLGLPFILINSPFYMYNQYTCSSYLARVLQENGIFIARKHFSLVTPKDFYAYQNMRVVFEGELSEIISEISYKFPENVSGGSMCV